MRGAGRSARDRIVGIALHFAEPGRVFAELGVLARRTDSGFDQLLRQLASRDLAVRQRAEDSMRAGLELALESPTKRLRFERQTGASVNPERAWHHASSDTPLVRASGA